MSKDNERSSENQGIKLERVFAVTPHNRALYEAGKTLLIESISTGKEFCKFMISVSTGAIPIYLGLLKFVLPESFTFSIWQITLATVPTILFLIASVVFAVGYFPRSGRLSLDIVDEIERERTRMIRIRTILGWAGFSIFLIGVLIAIASVFIFINV